MKLYEALEKQLKTENNFVADNGELEYTKPKGCVSQHVNDGLDYFW